MTPAAGPADLAEEAKRNDAVLKAAAVLMTAVFACTTVADSRVLVHTATGRYLAANGFLPPKTDVLSATAADRPWTNLSWLFDLGLAGIHGTGGLAAVTIFKMASAVGVAALIFACRRSNVSSWWASFVVVLATFAAMPHFEATPVIVTLLGVAITLRQLTRYRQELDDRAIWWLAPVFLVWANLDPRMFVGLLLLSLYGVGELAGMLLGRPGFEEGSRRGRYWLGTAAAAAAALVNPFGWHSLLGPLALYRDVDPAFRQYYGEEISWASLPHLGLPSLPTPALLDTSLLAGVLLAAVTLVAMSLNRRRSDFGDVAVWLGFVGLTLAAGRELPTAAVVFAVLAIQNAEDWYRGSFRQTYAADRGELIFSRGGRAVTVLAFTALAGLWLTGKISADDGRRPGFGLDAALSDQTTSLAELLQEPFDRKAFNFRLGQGDLLIWLGFKPFIDHRLELFAAGPGRDDLIELHDEVRRALRARMPDETEDPDAERPEVWKPALAKYGVLQAIPRLNLPTPDYRTYFDLLRSPDWRLARLGATGAVFYRADLGDPKLAEYLESHGPDFTAAAFREPAKVTNAAIDWPRKEGWADSLASAPVTSVELARALHAVQHLEVAESGRIQLPPQVALSFAYLALRDFYAVLATNPQSISSYRGLGRTYEMLYLWETRILQLGGSDAQMRRRLYQAIDAYGQALAIDPDDVQTHERLLGLYLGFGKADLAEHSWNEVERLTGEEPAPQMPPEQWEQVRDGVRSQVNAVSEQARKAVEQNSQKLEAAFFAWQNGCTRLALELVGDGPASTTEALEVQHFRAMLLLEAARPREAYEILAAIEPAAAERGLAGFREPFAFANLALPDFARAKALWRDDAAQAGEGQLLVAMQAVPLVAPFARPADGFPTLQTAMARQAVVNIPQEVAKGLFNAALCDLEAGRIEEAEKAFAELLDRYPITAFTPLTGLYLELIRGKPVRLDFGSPADGTDRFRNVEAALDRVIVSGQVEGAGPVEAPKPARPPENASGASPLNP